MNSGLTQHCMEISGIVSATQILREMNFRDYKRAKTAVLTFLEALNFDFDEFLHFLGAVFDQSQNSEPQKLQKTGC